MRVPLPLLCLCASVFTSIAALAVPIDLATATYATAAYAELGDGSDGIHSAASPPEALPLTSHAVLQNDGGDRAAADAIADTGFLAVSTDVASVLAQTGALADAALRLQIDQPGSYRLGLAFEREINQAGGGTVSAVLGLTLDVAGLLVFDESFDAAASIERPFTVLPGQIAVLDLHLQSLADALFGGGFQPVPGDDSAFALASVTAALERDVRAVPTPNTALLVCAALLPFARSHVRCRRDVRA